MGYFFFLKRMTSPHRLPVVANGFEQVSVYITEFVKNTFNQS